MSVHRTIPILLALAALLAASAASAQCTKDTDCKGDRVCTGGQCVAPATPPPPPALVPAPAEPAAPSATDLSTHPMLTQPSHWARPAGWVGIGAAAVVVGFGVVSAATYDTTALAISSGAIAFIAAAAGAPIVAVGGASARFDPSITGIPGLRIAGWVGYGLAMVTGAAMIISGFFVTYSPALILAVSGLGAASLVCLSVDAFSSANGADEYIASHAHAGGPTVLPTLTLSRGPRGDLAPALALAGAF